MTKGLRQHGPVTRREPRGFTLIELLVAIAIIGILVGLTLQGVQSARESARRLQCAANLRQIGLAMASYESVHRMFPPNELADRHGVVTNQTSGLAFILPYLEQRALFDSINFDFATIEDATAPTVENRTARNTRLAVFLCPSDGGRRHLTSYRLNRGRRVSVNRILGPFSPGSSPAAAGIIDGISNTAFVSERLGGGFSTNAGFPRDVRGLPVSPLDGDDEYETPCYNTSSWDWIAVSGRYWFYSSYHFTTYNHTALPNASRPSCGFDMPNNWTSGFHPPRSFHPGKVNVLYGDGRVGAVSDSVSLAVWRAAGTPSSGD